MKNFYLRFFSSLFLIPIFIFFLYKGNYYFYFFIIITILLSYLEIYKNIKSRYYQLFLYILVVFFGFSFIELRGNNFNGFINCLWVVIIVWLSDTGGYLFGKVFGGAKLTKFSPNKTISGLIGSIFLSQFAIIFLYYFKLNLNFDIKVFFMQLFYCILSTMGDIYFSYIKRINNLKDYSNIIPGHGGVLDRIDGLIFVVIFSYIINFIYVL